MRCISLTLEVRRADAPKREIERSADSVKRPSILAQLHEKQAERMAEPKTQKKKSHDMEL